MKIAEVITIDGRQAVKMPEEFAFTDSTISIRKEGEAVILEPVRKGVPSAGLADDRADALKRLIGIWKTDPSPTDDEVEQIIYEERLRKSQ